eukprot:CFRG5503T1
MKVDLDELRGGAHVNTMEFRFRFEEPVRQLHSLGGERATALQSFLDTKDWTSQAKTNLLQVLSELLIEPDLTHTVARLFRPVLVDLVDNVINVRVTSDNIPKLFSIVQHERIGTCLSLLLSLVPQLQNQVLSYYERSPPPFERICMSSAGSPSSQNHQNACEWNGIATTCYRLVRDAPIVKTIWNWGPFYTLLGVSDSSTRLYVAKTITLLLDTSSIRTAEILDKYVGADIENRSIIEQVEDEAVVMESYLLSLKQNSTYPEEMRSSEQLVASDLSSSLVDVCGILLRRNTQSVPSSNIYGHDVIRENVKSSQYIMTDTTSGNLRALALALSQGLPILLEGEAGSGKTSLVNELARRTDNDMFEGILKVHLGDQTDSKALLGTYICTDIPGEFKWQPGVLTQAMRAGKWLIVEDIDLAPMDVLSVLVPVLERREVFIPGRGEMVHAARGFQLFATQTLSTAGVARKGGGSGSSLLSNLWTRVVVQALTLAEMRLVLDSIYPSLVPFSTTLLDVYQSLANIGKRRAEPISREEMESPHTYAPAELAAISRIRRSYTYRDLLKWCNRCCEYTAEHATITSVTHSLLKDRFFYEGADVLVGMFPLAVRRHLLGLIAAKLDISVEAINHRCTLYSPEICWTDTEVKVGRVTLPQSSAVGIRKEKGGSYALTRLHARLIESVGACVAKCEAILLVGETGTGKTTLVQRLARAMNQTLVVINMSQQSDLSDLVGGFRPVDVRVLASPLVERFEKLFAATFSQKANVKFLNEVRSAYLRSKWKRFLALLNAALKMYKKKVSTTCTSNDHEMLPQAKVSRGSQDDLKSEWTSFISDIAKFSNQMKHVEHGFAFSFVEGSLVKAIKAGHWILLDEMNLAAAETLECLNGLLESPAGSIVLTERGDVTAVPRHPKFRLFGCMNPATDVGKRNLPPGVRSRFTELYVDELTERQDLTMLANEYLSRLGNLPTSIVDAVVSLYLEAIKYAHEELSDGANQKPHYSLRTLCRALDGSRMLVHRYGLQRALYEGFCSAFLTSLGRESYEKMQQLVYKHVGFGMSHKQLNKIPPHPEGDTHADQGDVTAEGRGWCRVEHIWLKCGETAPVVPQSETKFVLTQSTKENLRRISRGLVSGQFPILLQGPTSCGKTSMVEYMAQRSGHRFVRINNHEHTDLQEYLGAYTSDDKGRLVFQEGVLVQAVRYGYWVVLDELNLAPTDVLEALNRLLDDNRELMIPETQEVVKPHPHFRLFATQNPPGAYGGRKVLSRAFRNRFVELHFDDIPENELETILARRTDIAPSYCTKLVAILKDLQKRRQGTRLFAGKHGFITLRDLFRWAGRDANGYDQLATDGYMVLAEKCRRDDEKLIVKETIEKHLKVVIDTDAIYGARHTEFVDIQRMIADASTDPNDTLYPFRNIVETKAMLRLFTLVSRCLQFQEPILLVGETGCGKTTIFQLLAALKPQPLRTLNCHQHTETADFIGGLRPVRGRDVHLAKLKIQASEYEAKIICAFTDANVAPPCEGSQWEEASIDEIQVQVTRLINVLEKSNDLTADRQKSLFALGSDLLNELHSATTLFRWHDGPLVQAMRCGDMFMIDEISLADDSVLERLNSVLEPYRGLTLAEKGSEHVEEIVAAQDFRVVATMNPGGDFGKKELSPALRNRFTEIWVPAVTDNGDLKAIIDASVSSCSSLKDYSQPILNFVDWFKTNHNPKAVVSLRNILGWSSFMVNCVINKQLTSEEAFVHGGCLAFVDAVGTGGSSSYHSQAREVKKSCTTYLRLQASEVQTNSSSSLTHDLPSNEKSVAGVRMSSTNEFEFFADCFSIPCSPLYSSERGNISNSFALTAPTTLGNVQRVLRGLQLTMPILLEGSPGVGKTSLITAIAKAAGYPLVRINLSEQTDIMDLFGSDLPVEGGQGGEFAWRDGPFLQAMKRGEWILLDELNLASQSVLEGLNACLDHRGLVYIPELDQSFECVAPLRVFACQNPLAQGGGRKGLPKSFLNRFTRVHVDELNDIDLRIIASTMYPQIDSAIIDKMIEFNTHLHKATMVERTLGSKGGPWEFNLRDVLRWCEVMMNNQSKGFYNPSDYLDFLYLQRMRVQEDRDAVLDLFHQTFAFAEEQDQPPNTESWALACRSYVVDEYPELRVTRSHVQVGSSLTSRQVTTDVVSARNLSDLLPTQVLRRPLSHLLTAIGMQWMSIVVGDSASGKTSLVRLAARLTGNKLHEFSMNSAVDTSELLGGFEQVDLLRRRKDVVERVSTLVTEVTKMLVLRPAVTKDQLRMIQNIHNSWYMIQMTNSSGEDEDVSSSSSETAQGFTNQQRDSLCSCLDHVDKASDILHDTDASDGTASTKMYFSSRCVSIRRDIDTLMLLNTSHARGCFEWVDGILVRALKQGHWLLIDNANLCSPSVMDRLNPLMEPRGVLVISEKGVTDGVLETITPHPNFRLIMSVDPKYGELSRAMRNRGVEICLAASGKPHVSLPLANHDVMPSYSTDMVMLIQSTGVTNPAVSALLMDCHSSIKSSVAESYEFPLTVRDILHAARLVAEMLHRGFDVHKSVNIALYEVYVRCRRIESIRTIIEKVISAHLADFSTTKNLNVFPHPPFKSLPPSALWFQPVLLSGGALVTDPDLAMIVRDGMYLSYLKTLYVQRRIASESRETGTIDVATFGKFSSSLWKYLPTAVCESVAAGKETNGLQAISSTDEFNWAMFEQYFIWAGTYFLDRVSLSDNALRSSWLSGCFQSSVDVVGTQMLEIKQGLLNCLQSLAASPLTKRLYSVRADLEKVLHTPAGLLIGQPINCRSNSAEWNRLRALMGSFQNDPSAKENARRLWNLNIRIGNILSSVFVLRWYSAYKQYSLGYNAERNSPRTYSLLQQSFLIYNKRLPSSKASHPVCVRLYGTFTAFDAWLSDMLDSEFLTYVGVEDLLDFAKTEVDVVCLAHLLKSRDALWAAADQSPTNEGSVDIFSSILVHWKWFLKSLRKFQQCGMVARVAESTHLLSGDVLAASCAHVTDALQMELASNGLVLWKYWLRPRGFRSIKEFNVYTTLQMLSDTCDVYNETPITEIFPALPRWLFSLYGHPFIAKSTKAKAMLVEGLATLHTSERSGKNNPHDMRVRNRMYEVLENIPHSFSEIEERTDAKDALSAVELWPVYDHRSLVEEQHLVAQINALVVLTKTESFSSTTPMLSQHLRAELLQRVERHTATANTEKCSRSPADWAPWLSLKWLLSCGEVDVAWEAVVPVLCNAIASFHRRLRKNQLSELAYMSLAKKVYDLANRTDREIGSEETHEEMMLLHQTFVDQESKYLPSSSVSSQLFLNTDVGYMATLVSKFSTCAIGDVPRRVAQLKDVEFALLHRAQVISGQSNVLQEESGFSHIEKAQLLSLESTFFSLLLSFRKDFSAADYESLCEYALSAVRWRMGPISGTADEAATKFQFSSTDTEALLHLLERSTNEALRESVGWCARPYLELYQVEHAGAHAKVLLGLGWVHVGLLQVRLGTCISYIDPSASYALKESDVLLQSQKVESKIRSYSAISATLNGGDGHENSDVLEAGEQVLKIKDEMKRISARVLLRPKDDSFITMRSDFTRYLSSISSVSSVTQLCGCLYLLITKKSRNESITRRECDEAFSRLKIWRESQLSFIESIRRFSVMYIDIIQPLVVAIHQMVSGLSVLGDQLMYMMDMSSFARVEIDKTIPNPMILIPIRPRMTRLIVELLRFPTIERDTGATPFGYLQRMQDITYAAGHVDTASPIKSLIHTFSGVPLAMSGLRHAYIRIQGSRRANTAEQVTDISRLFNHVVDVWTEFEHEKLIRANSEAAEYKHREKTFVLEEESVLEERIYQQMCPSFDAEFADLSRDYTDAMDVHASLGNSEKNDSTDYKKDAFTADAVTQITDMHASIYASLASSLYCGAGEYTCNEQELLAAFKDNYEAAQALLEDPSLAEARKLCHIIAPLRKSVLAYLETWPEHPVLTGVMAVCDRILSLSLDDTPLMKLLSASELLLRQCMEWEAFAAEHVSLKDHTTALTNFIMELRKKELDHWSLSLDATVRDHEFKSRNLWFHLFTVINANPMSEVPQHDIPEDNMKLKRAEAITQHVNEVFEVVEQMFQTATIGDFACRLRLVGQFFMQLKVELAMNCTGTDKILKSKLHAMLGGFFSYYNQYLAGLQSKLLNMKKPLQKQLKEHVKLAKWNDINYWAMKQAGDRTHRALHKFRSKWSSILSIPFSQHLAETESSEVAYQSEDTSCETQEMGKVVEKVCDSGSWHMSDDIASISKLPVSVLVRYNERFNASDTKLYHNRLEGLTLKMDQMCRNKLIPVLNPSSIVRIDDLAVEIIRKVQQYRVWDIEDIKDTETALAKKKDNVDQESSVDSKSKDSRKLHKVMKRKDLAELFRVLNVAGLSYRVVVHDNETATLCHLFTESLLEDTTISLKTTEAQHLPAKSNEYFYKSVSRMVVLRKLYFQGRAQDITPQEADRCRGYSEHFLRLVVAQRTFLANVSHELANLTRFINHTLNLKKQLVDSNGQGPIVFSHMVASGWWNDAQNAIDTMMQTLSESMAVLDLSVHLSSVMQIKDGLKHALSELVQVRAELHAIKSQHLGVFELKMADTRSPMVVDVGGVSSGFNAVYNRVIVVATKIEDLSTSIGESGGADLRGVCTALVDAAFTAKSAEAAYRMDSAIRLDTSSDVSDTKVDEFAASFERDFDSLLKNILLNVQQVAKQKEDYNIANINNHEDEVSGQFFTQDFLTRSHNHVTALIKSASLPAINASLAGLCQRLSETANSAGVHHMLTACAGLFVRAIPLIERYSSIIGQAMDELFCLHKSVCKMQYILLNLFSELLAKGFCTPPDMLEADADEPTGGEIAGMGEGQGEKDVSDQIENEDQLTGTKDEEQNENEGPMPEEDNAVEMEQEFDGDLYDVDKKELQEMEDNEDADDDNENEQDVDDEMGNENMDDADVVDERMWGDDEEDNEISEKEKKEDGKSMTNENEESEVVAKQDDEEDSNENKDNDKDQKKDESEKKPPADATPYEEENEGMEDQINEVQELEEDHHHLPQEQPQDGNEDKDEEMNLPDDMQLDDNDGPDDGDKDGNDEADAIEDEEAGVDEYADVDQMPQNDDGESPQDGDVEQDTEVGEEEQNEESAIEGDEPTIDEDESVRQTAGTSDDENDDDESAEIPEIPEPMAEDSVDLSGEPAVDDEKLEDAEEEQKRNQKNKDKRKDKLESTAGVNTDEGERNSGETEDSVAPEGPGGVPETSSGADKTSAEDEKSSLERGVDDEQNVGSKQDKTPEINPFQSLGDALKQWKERLNVLDMDMDGGEDGEDDPADVDGDDTANGTKQFMREDEKCADDQVLGAATDEQASAQERKEINEDDVDAEVEQDSHDEKDDMDVDVGVDGKEDENDNNDGKEASSSMKSKNPMPSKPAENDLDEEKENVLDVDVEEKTDAAEDEVEDKDASAQSDSFMHTTNSVDEYALEQILTEEEIQDKRDEVEKILAQWRDGHLQSNDAGIGESLWAEYETITSGLSQDLCEQLRVILEPSLATRLQGDYRTGKRLNLKRVIPYIASHFKKDKIWLRRTKPAKREYQVLLAIDDSESMSDSHSASLAYEAVTMISKALTTLEVGQLSVMSFGDEVKLLHPFHEQFADSTGGAILQQLTFAQKNTNFEQLLETSYAHLLTSAVHTELPVSQLQVVISDGVCPDVESVRKWIRAYSDMGVLLVFVVLDNPKAKFSILDYKTVSYPGGMLTLTPYLETFPFPYYVVLRNINSLPDILADALRQWFELLTDDTT